MSEESGLELLGVQPLLCELASEHCSELSAVWVGDIQREDGERVRVGGARDSQVFNAGATCIKKDFQPLKSSNLGQEEAARGGQTPERADSG